MLTETAKIAATINLRVRQLEAAGLTGHEVAKAMVGHMLELKVIYDTVSDRTLEDLCRRFPAFERYAHSMEEVSRQCEARRAEGTIPSAAFPELPDPLKMSLMRVLRGAAELEREYQAAADDGPGAHTERLTTMRQSWADDQRAVVIEFQNAGLPIQAQAFVDRILTSIAGHIAQMAE